MEACSAVGILNTLYDTGNIIIEADRQLIII